MKKMMLTLAGGILGTMLMMGSQDAEARNTRYYRGGSRVVHSSRTVVHRNVVAPRYQHRVVHRSVVHRTHVPMRRAYRYVTTYTLRHSLSPWAYRQYHGYYRSNINLFCLAYPGLCIAATQQVYYTY